MLPSAAVYFIAVTPAMLAPSCGIDIVRATQGAARRRSKTLRSFGKPLNKVVGRESHLSAPRKLVGVSAGFA